MRTAWIDLCHKEVHLSIDGITFWVYHVEDEEDAERLKGLWESREMNIPQGRTSKMIE